MTSTATLYTKLNSKIRGDFVPKENMASKSQQRNTSLGNFSYFENTTAA